MVSAILAISDNNAVGYNNSLPWPHISDDMRWFKRTTDGHVIVMGRSTWSSLGIIKPLKNRLNVVVSSTLIQLDGAQVINNEVNDQILKLERDNPGKEIFIIGGAKLWLSTWPIITKFYVTRIRNKYDGDVFLDVDIMLEGTKLIYNEYMQKEGQPTLDFQIWQRQQ
jgi:dihydrofolate reductase